MLKKAGQEPEVPSAIVTIFVMFGAVAGIDLCLLLRMSAMYQRKWPGTHIVEEVFLYGPFVGMLYPGVRQLIRRRWIAGSVLIVAGLLLAWVALFLAGAVAWVLMP
jgi:hypothetical protein